MTPKDETLSALAIVNTIRERARTSSTNNADFVLSDEEAAALIESALAQQSAEVSRLRAELKKMDACWSLGHKHQENYIASLRAELERAQADIEALINGQMKADSEREQAERALEQAQRVPSEFEKWLEAELEHDPILASKVQSYLRRLREEN